MWGVLWGNSQVASIYEYRSRGIPTHIINADVIQSALLSESEELRRTAEELESKRVPRKRVRNKKLEEEHVEAEPKPEVQTEESIDDYTGPEDAKSISHELRGRYARTDAAHADYRCQYGAAYHCQLDLRREVFSTAVGGTWDPLPTCI